VLILADRLPSWILGCYGNSEVRTPALDRLAQTGLRFLNHFACAPAPAPGRATLLTGCTPMQLGDAGFGDAPLSKVLEGVGYTSIAADSAAAVQSLDGQPSGKPFFLTVDCAYLRPPTTACRASTATSMPRSSSPPSVRKRLPGMPPAIRNC